MKKLSLVLFMVVFAVGFALAQRTVVGSITDSDGEALIGASVLVKGTTKGTVTDLDGKYSVEVPEGANTLVISYTGYESQEVVLGASNVVNVTMAEGVTLETAVVTALGISRQEKSLGYAVKKVEGEEVMKAGETNLVQGLAAKASGVQVIGSGGTPGASSKILIRGNATFTGENQPLFVVDGIPYDNQTSGSVAGDYPFNANLSGVNNSNRALDINPADIESINILKGPAAAALYGTRAGNGVVLITTKKGRKGVSVTFNSSVSFDEVNKLPELQNEFGQGTGGGTLVNGQPMAEGVYVDDFSLSWGPRIGSPETPQAYDNFATYFETGTTYNNNLSVSLGNDNTTFRLSYGNTNQAGIVPNTDLNRNSFRLSADSKMGKFKLSGTASYVNTKDTKAQNGSNLSGIMLSLLRMPPSFNILGGEGPNGYDNPDGSSYNYFSLYDNPLWSANNNSLTGNVNRITGGITGTYSFTNWLDLTARLSADNYTDERKQIFAVGAQDPPAPVGEVWENSKTWFEMNADVFLSARHDFSDNINAVFTLGSNLNHRSDEDLFARGRNLAVPGFYNLSNASDLYTSQTTIERRLAGVFFDLNVGFSDMFYVGVSGRNDWASTFGADAREKGFFYPAVNASWVFSELIGSNDLLSFGKLRLSWAQVGIEPPPYRTVTYYVAPFVTDGFTDGLSFPYNGQNGFGLSSALGNVDLEPEVNTTYEAGVELKLFGNRISLDLNYYQSTSSNLLVNRPIASSTGFETVFQNFGEMVNKGWEIELGARILDYRNFSWDISGNFNRNVNEVTELAEGVDEINIETAFASIGSFAIKGQPYGALYATKWLRDANGNLMIRSNGIPAIDPARGNVGNPYPDWLMGIRNTFNVFGLGISGLLDIREGGDLWNGTLARIHRFGTTKASAERDRTYVIPGVKITGTDAEGNPITDGTPNDIAVSANSYFSNYLGDSGSAATEQAVQDGSWIRLRELTVNYPFPKLSKSGFVKGLNLYFTGRNLWLQTDYEGVDPETSLTGAGSNVGGFDYFNMPSTKSYIIGLDVTF